MIPEMHHPYRRVPARHARFAQARLVREDQDFYIPDFLSENPYRTRPGAYSAANEHAAELRAAEQRMDDALNLAGVLRAAVQGDDDSRAMQADTVLKIIEKKLGKARNCLDRHGARHLNLFMAYADVTNGPGESGGD